MLIAVFQKKKMLIATEKEKVEIRKHETVFLQFITRLRVGVKAKKFTNKALAKKLGLTEDAMNCYLNPSYGKAKLIQPIFFKLLSLIDHFEIFSFLGLHYGYTVIPNQRKLGVEHGSFEQLAEVGKEVGDVSQTILSIYKDKKIDKKEAEKLSIEVAQAILALRKLQLLVDQDFVNTDKLKKNEKST